MTRPAALLGCLREGAGFPELLGAPGRFTQSGSGEGKEGPQGCPSLGLKSPWGLGRGWDWAIPKVCAWGILAWVPLQPRSEDLGKRLDSAQIPALHNDGSKVLVLTAPAPQGGPPPHQGLDNQLAFSWHPPST